MAGPTVVVGHVTRAHGLGGDVEVELRSDDPERFAVGAIVFTPTGRTLPVERARPHGARLLVKFRSVDDRTVAESLRGQELVVPESWLPDLPEGEYWPFQLEGCEMVTESGRSLGSLARVTPNPANDLWVAVDDDGIETLVPAVHALIVDVDVDAGRIVVRDVPGLTAPDPRG
ncbi:MAG TPA: ribosome maturation factor RimM [Actinomycetota bacterium]|nr:ribosome maturation factor RimM [Actinomycetota bacterium]